MTERGNELRVGITLTIAALVLIFGILWLGGVKLGESAYRFSVVFPEVAGLAVGDRVTVAGISSGEVMGLQLTDGRVVAEISLDRTVRIPIDSRVSVSTYGLIGAKVVAVRPGVSDEFIEPGTTIFGYYEKGLGDVVAEMGEALIEIRQVLKAADEALADSENRRRVSETLENASVATAGLVVAVSDFKATAADLRSFVEQNRGGAASSVDSLSVASARMAGLMTDVQSISASLDSIVSRVEDGEGSLGKAISDEEAYDQFIAAVSEVRALVAEIRRNPKTFVRFSIF